MDTVTWIILAVVAVALFAAAAVWLLTRRSRTKRHSATLRERFGTEYDRAEEDELEERLNRYEGAQLRSLDVTTLQDCITRWGEVQADVIDWPTRAAVRAQRLLDDVMVARGFPVDHRERVAMLSVTHPTLVDDYRSAHATAVRALDGVANTEECRQALLRVRRLFDGLLGEPATTGEKAPAAASSPAQEREQERERLDLRTWSPSETRTAEEEAGTEAR
jgi:hypothetical protein